MGAMVQTINNAVTSNNSVKMTTLEKEMAVVTLTARSAEMVLHSHVSGRSRSGNYTV